MLNTQKKKDMVKAAREFLLRLLTTWLSDGIRKGTKQAEEKKRYFIIKNKRHTTKRRERKFPIILRTVLLQIINFYGFLWCKRERAQQQAQKKKVRKKKKTQAEGQRRSSSSGDVQEEESFSRWWCFFFGWKMCFCVLCVITYNFFFWCVIFSFSHHHRSLVPANISTGTLASRLVISRIIAPLVHSRSSSLLSLQSAARGSTWLCVRAYSESELSAPYCLIYIN